MLISQFAGLRFSRDRILCSSDGAWSVSDAQCVAACFAAVIVSVLHVIPLASDAASVGCGGLVRLRCLLDAIPTAMLSVLAPCACRLLGDFSAFPSYCCQGKVRI